MPEEAAAEKRKSVGAPAKQRMLRVEVHGLLHDWFDVEEMGELIRSATFAMTLRENIARYFGVPVKNQALYDEDGLLATNADLLRALQRVAPLIYVYNIKDMDAQLRNHTEKELAAIDAEVEQSRKNFRSDPATNGTAVHATETSVHIDMDQHVAMLGRGSMAGVQQSAPAHSSFASVETAHAPAPESAVPNLLAPASWVGGFPDPSAYCNHSDGALMDPDKVVSAAPTGSFVLSPTSAQPYAAPLQPVRVPTMEVHPCSGMEVPVEVLSGSACAHAIGARAKASRKSFREVVDARALSSGHEGCVLTGVPIDDHPAAPLVTRPPVVEQVSGAATPPGVQHRFVDNQGNLWGTVLLSPSKQAYEVAVQPSILVQSSDGIPGAVASQLQTSRRTVLCSGRPSSPVSIPTAARRSSTPPPVMMTSGAYRRALTPPATRCGTLLVQTVAAPRTFGSRVRAMTPPPSYTLAGSHRAPRGMSPAPSCIYAQQVAPINAPRMGCADPFLSCDPGV